MMRKTKQEKGITLIALVITIIVLLILAGITIITLTGENGILKKSQTASEETNKQTATEIINLKITNAQIKGYAEEEKMPDLQYLANRLCEDGDMAYVKIKNKETASFILPPVKIESEKDSILTKLNDYPYEFEIDGKLRLASIDGVKTGTNENDANYQQLKEEIENLKEEINTLKNENGGIKRTKLTTAPINISLKGVNTDWKEGNFANITLLDSIENYKYLAIDYDVIATEGQTKGDGEKTEWISVETLNYNNSNTLLTGNNSIISIIDAAYTPINCRGISFWFKDNKTLHVGAIWCTGQAINTFRIQNIYGIK